MHINEVSRGDLQKLKEKAQFETNSKQRDRYRAVALALDGWETEEIMRKLDRSRNFVQRWNYFYRDGGIEAIAAKPQGGRPTKLPRQEEATLIQRIQDGPTDADGGVCVLRGKDVQQILDREFGVKYTVFGVYDLMHRLGFSCLKPRPKHRKNDPEKMRMWLEQAPFLSKKSEQKIPGKKLRSGFRTKCE